MTVWGKIAYSEFETGSIVTFKGARISEFSGKSLNASPDESDLIFNLDHPEANKVRSWHNKTSNSTDFKPLSGQSHSSNEMVCSLAEMIEMVTHDPAIVQDGKAAYFKVEGFVSFLPGIADGSR